MKIANTEMLRKLLEKRQANKTVTAIYELMKLRLFVGFLELFNDKGTNECRELAERVTRCSIAGSDLKEICKNHEVDAIKSLIESKDYQNNLRNYINLECMDAPIEISLINKINRSCNQEERELRVKCKPIIMNRIKGDTFSLSKVWDLIKVKNYKPFGYVSFLIAMSGVFFTAIGYSINNIIASTYGFDADMLFSTEDYFMTGIKPALLFILSVSPIPACIIGLIIIEMNGKRYADEIGVKHVSKILKLNVFFFIIILTFFSLSLVHIFTCYINNLFPSELSVSIVAMVVFVLVFILTQAFRLRLNPVSRAFILLYSLAVIVPLGSASIYGIVRPHLTGEYESSVFVKHKEGATIRTLPLIIKGSEGSLVYDGGISSARFINEKYIISHDTVKTPEKINTNK